MLTPAITSQSSLLKVMAEDAPLCRPGGAGDRGDPDRTFRLFQKWRQRSNGRLFGPVTPALFLVLAGFGLGGVVSDAFQHPRTAPIRFMPFRCSCLRPGWLSHIWLGGAVVLAVTGCEALYADIKPLGKRPIQYAWLPVALPALDGRIIFRIGCSCLCRPRRRDLFFSVYPGIGALFPWCRLPLAAAIIASQAVIIWVFRLTQQAVVLGQLPRMEIRHTSANTTAGADFRAVHQRRVLGVGVVLIEADLQVLGVRWGRLMGHRGHRRHGDRHRAGGRGGDLWRWKWKRPVDLSGILA